MKTLLTSVLIAVLLALVVSFWCDNFNCDVLTVRLVQTGLVLYAVALFRAIYNYKDLE